MTDNNLKQISRKIRCDGKKLFLLGFACWFLLGFWTYLSSPRHAQLSKYAVFDEESDFQVKNDEIRQLEPKN